MNPNKSKIKLITFLVLAILLIASSMTLAISNVNEDEVELVILGTTDLHGYLYPINYFNGKDLKGSLARVSTLVKNERMKHDNVLLFDVGDTIQGSQLAYYWGVVNPSHEKDIEHVMAKAMNYMDYDAAVLGNHEFQIGKDSLISYVEDSDFPILSANTVYTGTEDLVFEPYTIIEKELDNGSKINVGVLGLTTPRWVQWYGGMVNYEFDSTDMYTTAERYVPEMKEEGADIVVALIHSGLSDEETKETTAGEDLLPEHDTLRIAKEIPNIDIAFYGHTHKVNTEVVTNEVTGDGVLLVQGKWHGRGIGKVTVTLSRDGDSWEIIGLEGDVDLLTDNADAPVEPDAELMTYMQDYQDEAIKYMDTVIGQSLVELNSKNNRYADSALFQLIAKAQRWGVEELYKDVAEDSLKNPVLSMVAPFLTGANGPDDYTMIQPGKLALKDAGAIYLYDDLLQAIEINGKTLKEYLERSAENFIQVTPNDGSQAILNPDFHGYYFDMIEGIKYNIDVTEPVGNRIKNLTYDGREILDSEIFTLLLPNYRAGGGGGFPGTGPNTNVIFNYTEGIETRDILIEYIKEFGVDLEASHDWKLSENFLSHWSSDYVYPLFRDGYILGEEQTGRLSLNDEISMQEYIYGLNKIFNIFNESISESSITRNEAAKMMADALRSKNILSDNLDGNKIFIDSSISQDLQYLSDLGIIIGYPDGSVRLDNDLTRGEMAAMFYKCLEIINN